MDSQSPVSDLLNDRSPYKAKDRANLNLPESQECNECHLSKPHTSFHLKKKNPFTAHLPAELEPTCIDCKAIKRDIKKGIFTKYLRSGNMLLSDAVVDELTLNNQQALKAVSRKLIELALDGDIDAMKMLVTLVQGRQPTVKPVEVSNKSEEIEKEPQTATAKDNTLDLLERVK